MIRALNRDLPYNQFVIDQIAGDLLPNATQDQIVATGFLRNSMMNEEGGVDPEQFRMEAMFDRMDAIGKGDPRRHHPVRAVPQPQVRSAHAGRVLPAVRFHQQLPRGECRRCTRRRSRRSAPGYFAAFARSRPSCSSPSPDWRERMAKWEDSALSGQPEWIVLRPEVDDISTGGQKYMPQPDGSLLAGGYAPTSLTREAERARRR